jgi:hypothetical protein
MAALLQQRLKAESDDNVRGLAGQRAGGQIAQPVGQTHRSGFALGRGDGTQWL